jgi:ATP-dependent Clp protease ATP-binding subunit ClpA
MNADKYTTKVREALGAAQNVAQHHGQQSFDAEHVLFALLPCVEISWLIRYSFLTMP